MARYYARSLPNGTVKPTVGPFRTAAHAHRAIAQALVDNGYERDRAAAFAFAQTVGTPRTHDTSGVTYWLTDTPTA